MLASSGCSETALPFPSCSVRFSLPEPGLSTDVFPISSFGTLTVCTTARPRQKRSGRHFEAELSADARDAWRGLCPHLLPVGIVSQARAPACGAVPTPRSRV